MAYDALNNLIDAYIYRNGIQAITGQILNGVLKQMVAQLGGGYNLMGVAIPATTPATNDEPLAYVAATAGQYTDFGAITLAAGEIAVLQTSGDGTWAKQTIYNVPTGTADLENTSNFITNAVTDLVNYYTKTEIDALPNGEDIDFDEDGKLQFANRTYNAQQPNGMGYKILRKNATFASQVTDINTIYDIRYDFNLGGSSFTMPSGCSLRFVGGSIVNGSLVYDNTRIEGNYNIDCDCSGILANEIVSPKMYGAKGDGITDDTAAFNAVQSCPGDVFVESGNYLLTNFVFSSSQRWEFKRSNGSKWWSNGAAKIVTSTGVRISNDPKIYNLVVEYKGSQSDLSQRPCGIYMTSHWAELYGVFVSYFRIGMAFGKPCQTDLSLASAHVDYTRVHNMQSWYNYHCGVSLDGGDTAQVNFISFFDCNVGANGVSVHDRTIQPDTTRGYGFYISTANSIYINNADVSANETCGIYIDANASTKVVRGLHVSTIYAEHNKYCDIYYNNGQGSSSTRTGEVSITDAYFFHDATDQYFVSKVFAVSNYTIFPCVKFIDYPAMRMEEGWFHAYKLYKYGMPPGQDNRMSRAVVTLLPNKKYRMVFTIMPKATGSITLQWVFRKFRFRSDLDIYDDTGVLSSAVVQSISVTEGVEKVLEIYVDVPSSDSSFVNWLAGGYGADSVVTDFYWEDLTNKQVSGTTAQRPAIANVPVGSTYFDKTLGKMLVSNGTAWVNMDGTALS